MNTRHCRKLRDKPEVSINSVWRTGESYLGVQTHTCQQECLHGFKPNSQALVLSIGERSGDDCLLSLSPSFVTG